MALFEATYTPPGVQTTVIFNAQTAALTGAARIPVLIGEGEQFFTQSNVEMHRGSSNTSDDQIVGENLSNQVTGTGRNYQLSHFPVVAGDGTGTVTNNPQFVHMTAGGLPVNVVSLNGRTGLIQTQTIIPAGTNTTATYYFKKSDTQILNESWASQIPSFATLAIAAGGNPACVLTLNPPGYLGNDVSLTFTAGAAVSDAQAVSGAGTNAISINITNPDSSLRTVQDLLNLVGAGIPTLSGYLAVSSSVEVQLTESLAAAAAVNFTGGQGPSTNTAFFVQNVPIVDGTNGGVVTSDPAKVQVKVAGVPVTVTGVDGATGLITLAAGAPAGVTATVTYYTNTYQNTADALPGSDVASLTLVGYGPNRTDFISGVDYVLQGDSISWGAAATTAAVVSTAGFTPLDASVINTTLIDEKVYLRPVLGAVDGINSTYTLADVPVDGSGFGRPTNNTALVSIYVGPNPIAAATAGPVVVTQLNGASATVSLYNPPLPGNVAPFNQVFASYYRTLLNDHVFTLTVDAAGIPGQGTYTIQDEASLPVALTSVGTTSVADQNFTDTGIVWPSGVPDLDAAIGGAQETVTVTFQNDNLSIQLSPPTQAAVTLGNTLTFTFSQPGTAGNAVTIALISGGSGAADSAAITVTGTAVAVELLQADGTTVRHWQDVLTLFAPQNFPPAVSGGTLLCTTIPNANLTVQASAEAATALAGGTAGTTLNYADRFLVTTSRTAAQALADHQGLTGGATTPSGSNTTLGATGYLGQTYLDLTTAVKFTLVDPHAALAYGYTQLPSPAYYFRPGDTLTFTVAPAGAFTTGDSITAIPGLRTMVVTTFNMNPTDTATISTFDRAASEPAVGEYYYVSFTTNKQPSDYVIQTFNSAADAYAVFGQPTQLANRLSIAVELLTENGAQQFACLQVPAQTGFSTASDQAFIDAINSLGSALAGGRKPNVIVPLSTSATVQQALSLYLIKQAAPRQRAEAIGFIGFDQYATPTTAMATAQSIANNRIIAIMPGAVGIMIPGAIGQQAIEYLLTGEFIAAAMAGLNVNPSNDVATTLTNQDLVGFSRSLIQYDGPTKDQMAAAGITVLNDVPGALEVRHYKTTDPSTALTSEPYVTTISDFIAQAFRKSFKQFIGRKITGDLPSSIEAVGNALLQGYMGDLITAATPVVAVVDANDPTTIEVSVSYVPVFTTLYINVTFTVNLTQ